jgi:hypothetical protein
MTYRPFWGYQEHVSQSDRYRKQAEEARWMAAYCHKPESKEVWTRVAEMWVNLANLTQKRAADRQILDQEHDAGGEKGGFNPTKHPGG